MIRSRLLKMYLDGFRSMTLGRTLWRLIAVKLVIMFAVLKLFFFPDILATQFATDAERAEHVLHQLMQSRHGWKSISPGESP